MKCDKGWKRRFEAFAGQNGPRPGEEGRGDKIALGPLMMVIFMRNNDFQTVLNNHRKKKP